MEEIGTSSRSRLLRPSMVIHRRRHPSVSSQIKVRFILIPLLNKVSIVRLMLPDLEEAATLAEGGEGHSNRPGRMVGKLRIKLRM